MLRQLLLTRMKRVSPIPFCAVLLCVFDALAFLGCDSDTVAIDPASKDTVEMMAPLHGQYSVLITPAGDTLTNHSLDAIVGKYTVGQETPFLAFNIGDEAKRIHLSFKWSATTGKYQVDSSTRGVRLTIFDRSYEHADGWIDITQYDLEAHELTATYELRLKKHVDSTESFFVRGQLNRIDFASEEHLAHPAVSFESGLSHPYTLRSNLGLFDVSENKLTLAAELTILDGQCRAVGVYTTRSVNLQIIGPTTGVYQAGGSTKWSYLYSTSPMHPACTGSSKLFDPTATDSLVISGYDPAKRHLSGWYTINGLRHDFNFTCWYKVE